MHSTLQPRPHPPTQSTGNRSVDALLWGGLPLGCFSTLSASDSRCIDELALSAVSATQTLGGIAAYIDCAYGLELSTLASRGVRAAELLISVPDTLGMALEVALHLMRSGVVDLLVVDRPDVLEPESCRRAIHALYQATVESTGVVLFTESDAMRLPPSTLHASTRYLSSVVLRAKVLTRTEAMVTVAKSKFAPSFTEAVITLNHPLPPQAAGRGTVSFEGLASTR